MEVQIFFLFGSSLYQKFGKIHLPTIHEILTSVFFSPFLVLVFRTGFRFGLFAPNSGFGSFLGVVEGEHVERLFVRGREKWQRAKCFCGKVLFGLI